MLYPENNLTRLNDKKRYRLVKVEIFVEGPSGTYELRSKVRLGVDLQVVQADPLRNIIELESRGHMGITETFMLGLW